MANLNKQLLGWVKPSLASKSWERTVSVQRGSSLADWQLVKEQCALNKNIRDMIDQMNDCSRVLNCISAWTGISISNTWVISLAVPDLNVTNASIAWWILNIIDQDWSNYNINFVASDAWNLIVPWTGWGLLVTESSIVQSIENAATLTLNDVITDDLTVTWTLQLPTWSIDISSVANTMSVTIGWQTDTAPIINSNVLSIDATNPISPLLVSTVNGIQSSLDIWALVNQEETVTELQYYEATTDNWLQYIDEDWVLNTIKLWHTETITPVANIPTIITHWLNSTRIHVVAYDSISWKEIDIEVWNRTVNTVEIVSTTSDTLEIVIKK